MWAKFDDRFHQNRKIVALSAPAFRLYVCSITYCCSERNGGTMSRSQALMVARMHRVNNPTKIFAELLSASCWTQNGDSYSVHDFAEFNSLTTSTDRVRRFRERSKSVTRNGEETVTGNDSARCGNAPVAHPDPSRPDPSPIPQTPLALRHADRPSWPFVEVLEDSHRRVRLRRPDGSVWSLENGFETWYPEAQHG